MKKILSLLLALAMLFSLAIGGAAAALAAPEDAPEVLPAEEFLTDDMPEEPAGAAEDGEVTVTAFDPPAEPGSAPDDASADEAGEPTGEPAGQSTAAPAAPAGASAGQSTGEPGGSEQLAVTYTRGSGEDVPVAGYNGTQAVELLRFDFGGDKSRNYSITEADVFGGRPAFTNVDGRPVLSAAWLETLAAGDYSVWLKDINSSVNYGRMTLTVVDAGASGLTVSIAEDMKSARAVGDTAGLSARIAVTTDSDDGTGLRVTRGSIGADGTIQIPGVDASGTVVTGVSVALAPDTEELTSAAPAVAAYDFVLVGGNTEPSDDPGASSDPGASGDPQPVTASHNIVTPTTEGMVVDFHTDLQETYLEAAHGGSVNVPNTITVNGVSYSVRGNAEYSKPAPIVLTWEGDESETYYVLLSTDPAFEEDVYTFEVTEATSVEVYNLFIGTDYYWRYAPSEEELDDSEVYVFTVSGEGPRNLNIDGVTNVRDIGGYPVEVGGKTGVIRQGLFLRGGRLNISRANENTVKFDENPDFFQLDITPEGIDTMLNELGVKTELDVRTGKEVAEHNSVTETAYNEQGNMNNDRIPGLEYVNIPVWYYGGTGNTLTRTSEAQGIDNPAAFRQILELMADESNYPIFYHCNIGTDRTGALAFFVGALCGMSENDLLIDYAFSNFGKTSGRDTSAVTGQNGYLTMVNTYPGDTLPERTENALVDICGVSHETLQSIRDILVAYD